MPAASEFGSHRPQLRLQPAARRVPQQEKASGPPRLPTDMREAEKVERLRLALATRLLCRLAGLVSENGSHVKGAALVSRRGL